MKVLVTGATGFLGAHVVRALRTLGHEPVAAARQGADRSRLMDQVGLAWVELDVAAPASVEAAVETIRPQAVVHCAAYGVDYRQLNTQTALSTNVLGTVALVEACAHQGVERFVHVGTCYEYGNHPDPITEHAALQPRSLYGSTKAAGGLLAQERARSLGLDLCVARPFGMYGPLEGRHKLVPLIQDACEQGRVLPLTGGEQLRDYLYVADAARALAHMLSFPSFPSGETFNLGSGRPIRLRAFVETCARVFGGESLMDFGALPYRPDEVWSIVSDATKWQAYYGCPVARTSLERGLAAMRQQTMEAR